jgi:hypothetical protein
MQAAVRDTLTVKAARQGEAERHGKIIEVRGLDGHPPYVVLWQDEHESQFLPASGTGGRASQLTPSSARARTSAARTAAGSGPGVSHWRIAVRASLPGAQVGARRRKRRRRQHGRLPNADWGWPEERSLIPLARH